MITKEEKYKLYNRDKAYIYLKLNFIDGLVAKQLSTIGFLINKYKASFIEASLIHKDNINYKQYKYNIFVIYDKEIFEDIGEVNQLYETMSIIEAYTMKDLGYKVIQYNEDYIQYNNHYPIYIKDIEKYLI